MSQLMSNKAVWATAVLAAWAITPLAQAQPCPEKNLMYWQAFPPGGESDLSARHQQIALKKKCTAIDTVVRSRLVVPDSIRAYSTS